jgi:hypothetical protein
LEKIQEQKNQQLEKIHTRNILLMSSQEEAQRKFAVSENLFLDLQKYFQLILNSKEIYQVHGIFKIKAFHHQLGKLSALLRVKELNVFNLQGKYNQDLVKLVKMEIEIQKLQSELKLSNLNFQSSKKENDVLQRVIVDKDNLNQFLRREIERFRSLLQMQEPLKQRLQIEQINQLQNQKVIQQLQSEISKTLQYVNSAQTPQSSSYFLATLDHQKQALAKLEKVRREFQEIESKTRFSTLKAVHHIVQLTDHDVLHPSMQNVFKPSQSPRINAQKFLNKQKKTSKQIQEVPQEIIREEKSEQFDISCVESLQLIGSYSEQKRHQELQKSEKKIIVLPVLGSPRRRKSVPPGHQSIQVKSARK